MASDISEKAQIAQGAKIGNNCKIYPFAYIEDDVVIGDNCVVYPFVSIMHGTRMGNDNQVYQGSVLGAVPQDFEFKGDDTQLSIGDHNIIRENVVINRATHHGGQTIIGHENFLMEGSHISHDTKMGNQCVLGYGTKISGNCEIGNGVIFSSSVIESENTRIGDYAMIQAGTTLYQDVPPYIIAGGIPAKYAGLNSMMLQSYGISERVQKHIANAYRLVFHGQTSVFDAVLQVQEQVPNGEEINEIVRFIQATKAGIIGKL